MYEMRQNKANNCVALDTITPGCKKWATIFAGGKHM